MARIFLLLFTLAFVSAIAAAEPEEVLDTAPVEEDVSESLGTFLGRARDAGLLSAPGSELSGNERPNNEAAGDRAICAADYPLDFSDYMDVRSYSDIARYREALRDEDGEEPHHDETNELGLLRAYLALGLYSEAIAEQDHAVDQTGQVYGAVAQLMDDYLHPDASAFEQLADCHSEGELWLAISRISSNDVSGIPLLERHLEGLRDLPLRLRVDVATLLLPELRHNGLEILAKKLLATFEREEVHQSSKLNIQASFLADASLNGTGSQSAHDFLSRVAPGADALVLGVEAGRSLSAAQRAVVLEHAYWALSQPIDARDKATALKFVLEDLALQSDYMGYSDLLEMQSLAAPVFQREIKESLAVQLGSVLEGEATLPKLAAIELLVNAPHVIAGHPAEDSMKEAAIEFLKSQGRFALAASLLEQEQLDEEQMLLVARSAYQKRDTDTLYALAQVNKGNAEIVYLSASAAIQAEDGDMVRSLEKYLPQDAEVLVSLAEEDAAIDAWFLSEETYEAARSLATPDQLVRLERVLSLKQSLENPFGAGNERSIAGRISAVNVALSRFERGVN
ncbi:MAG: hypothetical protein ABJG15_01340 [Hyphomonadaceae bacterium]